MTGLVWGIRIKESDEGKISRDEVLSRIYAKKIPETFSRHYLFTNPEDYEVLKEYFTALRGKTIETPYTQRMIVGIPFEVGEEELAEAFDAALQSSRWQTGTQ